jgi:branched-chain amino acid transport system ATP-binding protein
VAEPLLALEGVHRNFGGVQAVQDLSFAVEHGEVVGLIGPNGSGKSTTVNLISGTLPPTRGEIRIEGRPVSRLSVAQRVPLGLARTFQTTSVFPEYPLLDHVLTAAHTRYRRSPLAAVLRTPAARAEEHERRERAREILEFVGLGALAASPAAAVSSAQQRLLMIAGALASEPRLLLLDEPAAGMVAAERRALADLVLRIRDRGVAVLIIEHHMGLIMEVCRRIVVLDFGAKIAEGEPARIRAHPAVVEAYLGGGA